MSALKCIAFDADNTLYQTRDVAKSADMAAMEALVGNISANSHELAGKTPDDLYEEWVKVVEKIKTSSDPKIRHRVNSYGLLAKSHNTQAAEQMYAAFSKKLLEGLQPMLGITNLLPKLAERYELWVITEDNKPMTLNKLYAIKIDKYFAGVISSDDTNVMKPSQKYFEKLLQKFKPKEILVVGDNREKDLAIPEQLGMKTLLVKSSADLQKILVV